MSDENTLRRPIGWWLKEADTRLDAAFDVALAEHGLDRRGWQVLATLDRAPAGRADVTAALAAFDASEVTDSVIDQLLGRGWIDEADGLLQLTADGAHGQTSAAALVAQIRHHVSDALPGDDYTTLIRLLARLVAAFPESKL
jgi:hypothetical protein